MLKVHAIYMDSVSCELGNSPQSQKEVTLQDQYFSIAGSMKHMQTYYCIPGSVITQALERAGRSRELIDDNKA